MAKRSLLVKSVIGPGVANKNTTVDVQPAYRFVDGTVINWPLPKRYELENGQVTISGVEDTYAGEFMVWQFDFRDFDSVNRQIGDTRIELRTFEGATGTPVDYATMHMVQEATDPEYGPTFLEQTRELRDETAALLEDTQQARDDAAAFAGTNNAQVAGMVTADGPTKTALSATIAAQATRRALVFSLLNLGGN